MGSLSSRPKAPPPPKTVVYTIPAPVYPSYPPPPAAPENPAPGGGENPAQPSGAAGLLERRRGVFSTVLTGFRGLLGDTVSGQRKTLLGE